MPARFYSVEEVYNTNRNPAEMGIVHPLMYENEDSLVGQLGYGTGALHNSDQHSMTWCRNFDGGRSFTTTLGHNWQFSDGDVVGRDDAATRSSGPPARSTPTASRSTRSRTCWPTRPPTATSTPPATALSAALASADAAYRAGDNAARGRSARQFVAHAKRVANCGCADGGAALLEIQSKGVELVNWMSGDGSAPPAPRFADGRAVARRRHACRRRSRCRSARRRRSARSRPGVAQTYTAGEDGQRDLDGRRRAPERLRPERHRDGPPGQRLVLAGGAGAGEGHQRPGAGAAFAAVGGSSSPTSLLTYSRPDVQ